MTEFATVATGETNPTTGSIVVVGVTDLLLAWEVQKNVFNDWLPIIPMASRVQNGLVLYSLKIKATLTSLSRRAPVVGHAMTVTSSRPGDKLTMSSARTGADGSVMLVLETREKGTLKLSIAETDVTGSPFSITLKDAWYESTFLITGYNVCDEADFSGPLVSASGLSGQHRDDFLFSARGVVMQGTGKSSDGQYVRPTRVGSRWTTNARGNPTRISNPQGVSFTYTTSVQGAFGQVSANHSMAVDPTVIPPHAQVEIESVGARFADDRGSRIIGHHIDNFLGSGDAVVQTWGQSGVNSTQRKVKFKG